MMETHRLLFQNVDYRWVCCINIQWFIKHTRLTLMSSKMFFILVRDRYSEWNVEWKYQCKLNYNQTHRQYLKLETPAPEKNSTVQFLPNILTTQLPVCRRPFLTLKGFFSPNMYKIYMEQGLHNLLFVSIISALWNSSSKAKRPNIFHFISVVERMMCKS